MGSDKSCVYGPRWEPTMTPAIRSPFALIPRPVSVTPGPGHFTLTAHTVIHCDAPSALCAELLAQRLRFATGFDIPVQQGESRTRTQSRIRLQTDLADSAGLPESYTLSVATHDILITAPRAAGIFYATQTLLQLLPPDIFRDAPVPGVSWSVPGVRISDCPRFAWRGLMLDVSRHYMPKSFIKRFMDLMALHKLNVLHLHLTDDQGWRLEIKPYPRLTSVGAWRDETVVDRYTNMPQRFNRIRHGGYYTHADIHELVEYGHRRMITIVPEIEMPGHAQAAIAAYPELGNLKTPLKVSGTWGIHRNIFRPHEKTLRFLQHVLMEVMDLFPSPFIHIGGDEAVKDQWKASPDAQRKMRQLKLASENELQSWFIRQMDDFLTAHKRRLIGWDEILEGGLAPGAAVMSWRGIKEGIEAARAGHDVVMAPHADTYFDYYQTEALHQEPLAIGGFLPLEKTYAFEPVPATLTAAEARHILGAQGQLWSEYIPTPSHMEYMAFPRAAALAETTWSQATQKRYTDFERRMKTHETRLQILDVNYRRGG